MAEPRRWRRFFWKWSKRLLVLVVLVFLAASWFIFPRYITRIDELNTFFRRGRGKSMPQSEPSHTFTSLDGLKLAFDWVSAPGDSVNTTIILLNGIRANRHQHSRLCDETLVPAGYNVVLLDHRAHGHSEGEWCTFGVKEGMDVKTLIDTLEGSSLATDHYVVWGYSLGGSVAAQALALDDRIDAGIIESTYATYPEVVHQYMSRFAFNSGWYGDLLIHRAASMADFEVEQACTECVLATVKQPIFLSHGTHDRSIPFAHGQRNYDAIPHNSKTFVALEGYGHRGVVRGRPADYLGAVMGFLERELVD